MKDTNKCKNNVNYIAWKKIEKSVAWKLFLVTLIVFCINWKVFDKGSWTISTRECVDIACKAKYVNSKTIEQDLKQKNSNSDKQPFPRKLRSSLSFEFKICCLYCCQAITEREFRDHKAFQLMSKNREFNRNVVEVCDKRNGTLAISVKGRIRFTTDLHTADTV